MLALYDACDRGKWTEAAALQRTVTRFVVEALQPLLADGYWDAAIDKALLAATGFLSCPPPSEGTARCQPSTSPRFEPTSSAICRAAS